MGGPWTIHGRKIDSTAPIIKFSGMVANFHFHIQLGPWTMHVPTCGHFNVIPAPGSLV